MSYGEQRIPSRVEKDDPPRVAAARYAAYAALLLSEVQSDRPAAIVPNEGKTGLMEVQELLHG